eukprot:6782325-Prymnesium_polylepis.2
MCVADSCVRAVAARVRPWRRSSGPQWTHRASPKSQSCIALTHPRHQASCITVLVNIAYHS